MKMRGIAALPWMELPDASARARTDIKDLPQPVNRRKVPGFDTVVYAALGLAGVLGITACASAILKLLGAL